MSRRYRKPTKAQDRAALKVQWAVHTIVGGYQEPRYSDQRHRWAWQENKYAPGGRIVSCESCACVLTKAGPSNWRCFGAGRP